MTARPPIVIVIVIAIAIVATILVANSAAGGIVGKGFRVGVCYSELVTTDVAIPSYYDKAGSNDSSDWKPGLALGLFLDFGLSEHLGIQPELFFYRMGGQNDFELTDEQGSPIGTGTESIDLDYLQFTVLFRCDILGAAATTPYLVLGPAVASNIAAMMATEPYRHTRELDWVENVEFSAVVGAGCDLAVGQVTLVLDVRYNHGLSGIRENVTYNNLENRSWQFTVGMGF